MLVSSMVILILEQLEVILEREKAEAYFVGGSVRDLLLGRPLHDLDLVVAGEAMALARTVANAFHGAYVPLDEENGVARAVLRGREGGPSITLDFARMRPHTGLMRPHTGLMRPHRHSKLPADLAARDFSINAMAMTPPAFLDALRREGTPVEVIDPCGGRADLQAGHLRAIRQQALLDDPLRTLRAVRLAAELNFIIEPQSADWIRRAAAGLQQVSWERIRDEIARLLACPRAAPYLPLLDHLELWPHVLPELQAAHDGAGLGQLWETVCCLEWLCSSWTNLEPALRGDALWMPAVLGAHPGLTAELPLQQHLRTYLHKRLSAERTRLVLLKLAALLYPALRQIDASQDDISAKAGQSAGRVARRLRLSRPEAKALSRAVSLLAGPKDILEELDSKREIYRLYRDSGEIATGVLLLVLAGDLATAGPALNHQRWQKRLGRVGWILDLRYEHSDTVITPPTLLDGNELMAALELEPGPRIGELLEGICEAQVAGEVHTREQALEWARRTVEISHYDL